MAAHAGSYGAAVEGGTPNAHGAAAGDPISYEYLTPVQSARRSQVVRNVIAFLLPITDVAMLTLAFALSYLVRETLPLPNQPDVQPSFVLYIPTMILHVSTIVTIFYFTQLYHLRRASSRIDQGRNIIGSVTIGALVVNGLQEFFFRNTTWEPIEYPRSMFFYAWILSVVLVLVGREAYRIMRLKLREHGIEQSNLLIVGMGKIARQITKQIKNSPDLGYHIVGIVNTRPRHKGGSVLGYPIIGGQREIPRLIDQYAVEQVIIALPDAQRDELVELINVCRRGRVDIKIYPDLFAFMAREMSVDDLSGIPLISVRDIALRGWKLSLKRGLDLVGSLVGLIVLSPLMLLTALLVRLESPGPIFFTQERMGLDGRPFQMIKFRTMRADAEVGGPGWTVPGDPRVTRLGRLMRRTSWDEIPQLINVFLGEMSLVGPRPERPVYVREFRQKIPRYMERHREKSGMTGWAQVNGLRGDTSIEERTLYDLWYVENWSLWLDVKIILRTILNVLLRRDQNAY